MNLYEKLLDIQIRVDSIVKDGTNASDKYDFASDENVLNKFRPMMDELKLLLIPRVTGHTLHEGTTKTGTVRFLTEIDYDMVWHDVESGEELSVSTYAQGVDLAGEKGPGKSATYAEKYFLLKFFHVPTKKDDPDSDGHTESGEKKQRGTQAAKENALMLKQSVAQMVSELCAGDAEKIKATYFYFTKNDASLYAGVDDVEKISNVALPVVYANVKKNYEKKLGKPFVFSGAEEV